MGLIERALVNKAEEQSRASPAVHLRPLHVYVPTLHTPCTHENRKVEKNINGVMSCARPSVYFSFNEASVSDAFK